MGKGGEKGEEMTLQKPYSISVLDRSTEASESKFK